MNVILDANPADFDYAVERASKRGDYVFVAQGDPAVMPRLVRGVSHVRKNIAPKWTHVVYGNDGSSVIVPAMDVLSFSKDVGVQQWDAVRLDENHAAEILAVWPGPIARKIETTAVVSEVTARHLRQWYRESGLDWEIAERAI